MQYGLAAAGARDEQAAAHDPRLCDGVPAGPRWRRVSLRKLTFEPVLPALGIWTFRGTPFLGETLDLSYSIALHSCSCSKSNSSSKCSVQWGATIVAILYCTAPKKAHPSQGVYLDAVLEEGIYRK